MRRRGWFIDRLERRLFLAASATVSANGILHIRGTPQSDTITISRSGQQIIARVGGLVRRFDRRAIAGVSADGSGGDDTIEMRAGLASSLIGGDGDDTLIGGPGPDHFFGDGGRNELRPTASDDVIDFSDLPPGRFESEPTQNFGLGIDYASGSVVIILDAAQPFRILGTPGNDLMEINSHGSAQDEVTVDGGSGNDTFNIFDYFTYDQDGETDRDIDLVGGSGNDRFYIDGDAPSGTRVFGGAGDDYVLESNVDLMEDGAIDGGSGRDTVDMSAYYPETESPPVIPPRILESGAATEVIYAPFFDYNYRLEGNDWDNEIYAPGRATVLGMGGDDLIAVSDHTGCVLNGGKGNDTLISGRDTIDTPQAGDTLIGGPGDDTADYSRSLNMDYGPGDTQSPVIHFDPDIAPQRITLDNKSNDGSAGENDNVEGDVENILGGSGNDYLQGNPSANSLVGNAGNDTLWGGAGNDTLDGGLGHDQLFGQDGNDDLLAKDGEVDSLDGGPGIDLATYDQGPGVVDKVTGAGVASFQTINYPGSAGTQVNAISGGILVGEWFTNDNTGRERGFIYDGKTFRSLDVPGTADYATLPNAIDGNKIVGTFSHKFEEGFEGFLYDGKKFITLIDPMAAGYTIPNAIAGNKIVGTYEDSSGVTRGFLFDGSTWTTLAGPRGNKGLFPQGIRGDTIVGWFINSKGHCDSFIFDGKTYTTFDDPLATQNNVEIDGTRALAISGKYIVGVFEDGDVPRGFAFDGKRFMTINVPNASQEFKAVITGIAGDTIVGWYDDKNLGISGFIGELPDQA